MWDESSAEACCQSRVSRSAVCAGAVQCTRRGATAIDLTRKDFDAQATDLSGGAVQEMNGTSDETSGVHCSDEWNGEWSAVKRRVQS